MEPPAEPFIDIADGTLDESALIPIYAKYGQAMALAQTLEMFVVQMIGSELLARHREKRAQKPFDVDRVLKTRLGQQLGANIHEFERLVGPSPTITDLKRALQLRNHLTHHFWRDRMLTVGSHEGRGRVDSDLDEMLAWLLSLNESLAEMAVSDWHRHGLSDEDQAAIGRQLSAVFNGDASLIPAWTLEAMRGEPNGAPPVG